MSQNTSQVSPPQLPPMVRTMMVIFSTLMTLVLLAFVGLVAVEFTAEMLGYPLFVAEQTSIDDLETSMDQDWEDQFKNPFELITPKHETQMQGPEIVVIYTVRTTQTEEPDLRVNGVPHPWEIRFGAETWFARLQLSEGLHQLQAGEAEAKFFIESPDTPLNSGHSTWRRNRPHLDTNNIDKCVQCHEMHEKPTDLIMSGIGKWRGPSSCFECHDQMVHVSTHQNFFPANTEHSLKCVRCHVIH